MSCRPAALHSDYNTLASSATHLIPIVLIFNFTSSTFSSGKFRSCTVSLIAFLLAVLLLQCSDFVTQALMTFHKIEHQWCVAVLPFKIHGRLFANRPTENKPDSKQEKHSFISEEHAVTRVRYSLSIIHSG